MLNEYIAEMEQINKKLAKLTKRKEELTSLIIDELGHNHEGQKSYDFETWKIECKTPFIYSLDKKAYESGDVYLPAEFNPVKSAISYTVDKKLCDKYMSEAPLSVRDALSMLIEKKPSKPSVTIKARA